MIKIDEEKTKKNILDHREYNIKLDNNEYNLRLEIDNEYLYFILSIANKFIEYFYENKMNLLAIINKFELNSSKYSNLELILKIFDSIYKKNKIFVQISDDNSCILFINIFNMFEEEVVKEIKLYKKYMNSEDRFNVLYNKLKPLKKENILEYCNEIGNIKNKLDELNINIDKREKELKDILNEKENIIQELNKKLINQDKEIINLRENFDKKLQEIENKLINNFKEEINNINNALNDKINKQKEKNNIENNNEIELKKENYKEIMENLELKKKLEKEFEKNEKTKIDNKKREKINNKLINNFVEKNYVIKEIELNKEEIKKMSDKIKTNEKDIIKIEKIMKEKEIIMNKLMEKISNQKIIVKVNNNNEQIDYRIKDLKTNINNKYNELNEKINHNLYLNKINYVFKKEPQNLKYKLDINNSNSSAGWNDMFEVFISYKDSKEYLISPNINNYALDVIELLDNKKITSLKGHKNNIRSIRYFIDKKNSNYNEYLISADDNKIVIIWDITNNYNIKYTIDTKYGHNIYSCLLVFPNNLDENYIVTSSYNESDNIDKSSTKIYSLNNGKFCKYIENTNNKAIYYLLSWYNNKNNKYYIIQFSFKKIIINNLLEDELYSELIQEPEDNHFSGFIFNKDNIDYLCSSSSLGYINIWDLYSKSLDKSININNCKLAHIIQWNDKFILVADYNNKSFKIIDLENNKLIYDINGQHTDKVVSIKKINHPVFGEALLSTGRDKTLKLWSF